MNPWSLLAEDAAVELRHVRQLAVLDLAGDPSPKPEQGHVLVPYFSATSHKSGVENVNWPDALHSSTHPRVLRQLDNHVEDGLGSLRCRRRSRRGDA